MEVVPCNAGCRSWKELGSGQRFALTCAYELRAELEKVAEVRTIRTISTAKIEKTTVPNDLEQWRLFGTRYAAKRRNPILPNGMGTFLSQQRKRIESGEAKFYSIEEAKR